MVVLRRGWTLMVVAMIMMVAVVAGARRGPEGHEEVGARGLCQGAGQLSTRATGTETYLASGIRVQGLCISLNVSLSRRGSSSDSHALRPISCCRVQKMQGWQERWGAGGAGRCKRARPAGAGGGAKMSEALILPATDITSIKRF